MTYLDTSAALKLVMPEAETPALELWIAERAGMPRVSSRLLRIEMLRSVARYAPDLVDRANIVLSSVVMVSLDDVAPTAEVIATPLSATGKPVPRRNEAVCLVWALDPELGLGAG